MSAIAAGLLPAIQGMFDSDMLVADKAAVDKLFCEHTVEEIKAIEQNTRYASS